MMLFTGKEGRAQKSRLDVNVFWMYLLCNLLFLKWLAASLQKITRGHNFTLVKEQSRLDVR